LAWTSRADTFFAVSAVLESRLSRAACVSTERNREGEESQLAAGSAEPDFGVSIVARQFSFEFDYPEFDLSGREELVLPLHRAVTLTAKSEDVIHSFHAPEIGLKLDAVPEERTELTVVPRQTAECRAYCAEFCGKGHSDMSAQVRLVSESEFENWRS
jgi:cytochrome c oxidase subunit 2